MNSPQEARDMHGNYGQSRNRRGHLQHDGNIVQSSSAEDVQVNTKASKNSPQSAKESHGVPDQYIQMLTHAGNLQCREWSRQLC